MRNWLVARRLGLLAVALLSLPARNAVAHDVDGKLGIGFEDTLTNIGVRQAFALRDVNNTLQQGHMPDIRASGLAVRRYVGNVGLEAIVGFGVHLGQSPDPPVTVPETPRAPNPPAEWGTFLSIGGSYNVVRAPQVNLAVGLRVLAGLARTNNGQDSGPVRFGIALEAPIRIEYFFNQQFAIAGAVGPTLGLRSDQANPLTGEKGAIDIALARGEFSGGIGFTYYLN